MMYRASLALKLVWYPIAFVIKCNLQSLAFKAFQKQLQPTSTVYFLQFTYLGLPLHAPSGLFPSSLSLPLTPTALCTIAAP